MKRMSISITEPQDEGLKKRKKKTGLSIGELIRRAIDLLLEEKRQ